jgi:hypothetical protein
MPILLWFLGVPLGVIYEVRYLAEKHGLSVEQARKLIERFGYDREKLEAAARQLTS